MRLGHRAYWSFNLYPPAGEGGGCFVPPLRSGPVGGVGGGGGGPGRAGAGGGGGGGREGGRGGADPGRAEAEAARRARAKVRRYGAANRLNRFWTLTYAGSGCFDQAQVRTDLGEFFRGLRSELGEAFPYVWVPEWHPGGHGLH